jgi:hypothetical protein
MGGFGVTADYCADDFVLGNEAYKLGEIGGTEPPCHRPHGDQLQLYGFDEAPGAVDASRRDFRGPWDTLERR